MAYENNLIDTLGTFEEALNINSDLAVAYYYIGNSYEYY